MVMQQKVQKEMVKAKKIIYIAELLRAHSIISGGALAVIGALCITHTIFNFHILLLLVFGTLCAAFGTGLNEICDVEYDRRTSINKILVRGDISLGEAKIIVTTIAIITIITGIYLAYPSLNALFTLIIMILSGVCYDLYSKKTTWASIYFGGWIFFLILFGAIAVGGPPNPLVFAIASYCAFFMIEEISIQGAIKDIATDPSTNVALALGCYANKKGDIYLSSTFKLLALSLKIAQYFILFYVLFYLLPYLNFVLYFTIPVLLGANTYTFIKLMNFSSLNRRKSLNRNNTLSSVFSFSLIGFTLSVFVSLYELLLLLCISLIWLFVLSYLITGVILGSRQ